MSTAVWKFPINIVDDQQIEMPEHAQILHVGGQDGRLCLWVRVNPANAKVARRISVRGTGHTIEKGQLAPANGFYLGSAQVGPFVWHVFEAV
jgi:hypothetical protein